ncbi:TetR/AcrR family transcriptional regulator [uncultured Microbacterium sp.]|uniref:TetR/AcrR family transcriptional regulator n=1 Tax=uncultured Microbacterium sp. TaxID=191216 RepID=UPI0025DD69A6|nr:TetR/AcrR family transcriptional regulator [uncultured Microbacterium sp.]
MTSSPEVPDPRRAADEGGMSAKQRRRERISGAAMMLFAERGFDGVSIAEIADAAGVSKMTVTNHFPLKEDLVFDEFDGDVRRVAGVIAGVSSVLEAVDAIEGYCVERERTGGTARALATADPDAWRGFAALVLGSRALTLRFHAQYLDVRDAIDAALPEALPEAEGAVVAWMLAEAVHLVDWWPYEQVARGATSPAIRAGRAEVRVRAFAALRDGLGAASGSAADPVRPR